MLATTLRGVISQRLVRATDGGRVPVCEILRMTGRARDKILKPSESIDLTTVITEGGYDGMQTFDQALYTHVHAKRISIEDAMTAATSPHDFKLLLESEGRRGTTMDDVPTNYEDDEEPDDEDIPARADGFATTMDDVPSVI
jgi:twitching motility protein PilT